MWLTEFNDCTTEFDDPRLNQLLTTARHEVSHAVAIDKVSYCLSPLVIFVTRRTRFEVEYAFPNGDRGALSNHSLPARRHELWRYANEWVVPHLEAGKAYHLLCTRTNRGEGRVKKLLRPVALVERLPSLQAASVVSAKLAHEYEPPNRSLAYYEAALAACQAYLKDLRGD